jgi:hypothetical protein
LGVDVFWEIKELLNFVKVCKGLGLSGFLNLSIKLRKKLKFSIQFLNEKAPDHEFIRKVNVDLSLKISNFKIFPKKSTTLRLISTLFDTIFDDLLLKVNPSNFL